MFPISENTSCTIHQVKQQSIIRCFPFFHLIHKLTPVHSNLEGALKFISSPSVLTAALSDQNRILSGKRLSLPPGFPVPSSFLPCIPHTIIRGVSKAHLDHLNVQWLLHAYRMHVLLRTHIIFHSETATYFSFNHISYIPQKPSMLSHTKLVYNFLNSP